MEPKSPPPSPPKLRLMCSYGGQILPRPHKRSLYYVGGDTRIVSLSSASAVTLSSFGAAISSALNVPLPFTLKYQLPHHDLDSLVSLSADEDIPIMLEEHHRLSSSRIRLFVFQPKPVIPQTTSSCIFQHPKTESWFFDALKSAKIMQKGGGVDGDTQNEGSSVYGQESIVLETGSSYGSSSSSVSLSNLPSIKGQQVEDSAGIESVASDYGISSSHIQSPSVTCQDNVASASSKESQNLSGVIESEHNIHLHPSGSPRQRPLQVSGAPVLTQLDPLQNQQVVNQHVASYINQNSPSLLPISSPYAIYHPQVNHSQHNYLPNQPYPVYLVPVGQTQSSYIHSQGDLIHAASSQLPVAQYTTVIPPQSTYYKEVTTTAPISDLPTHLYRSPQVGIQFLPVASSGNQQQIVHMPVSSSGNQQQIVHMPPMQNQPPSAAVSSVEAATNGNSLDDDPTRAQIYKSQPPAPSLPSQF